MSTKTTAQKLTPKPLRGFIEWLANKDLYNQIAEDDLIAKQRYRLFTIFSFAGFLIAVLVALQAHYLLQQSNNLILWSLIIIACVYVLNYVMLLRHRNMPVAYTVTLLSTFAVIHLLTYYSGGIRNSGMFYLGALVLCAFMLLGSRGGKIIAFLSVLHIIYFYFITENTNWVTNILVGGSNEELLDQDFLITGVLAIFFIAAQVNYLESGRNIVIQRITQSRNELRQKNIELADNIRALEKINRELDKFASIVSHDLKAPLRAIGNLTGWIETDMKGKMPPEVQENFDAIKQRVRRMEGLINGLLEYSKADRKRGEVMIVDLKKLVTETFDFIGKPENVELKFASSMPVFSADKLLLEQIFSNLLDNAVKYNDKSTVEIKISAEEVNNHWLFAVTDNGPGIDPQYHEKVFVIFQTLKRRDEVESTGVGLAIVKKIIEERGGKIWVESEAGKGATFKFTWPKSPEMAKNMVVAA
jgi:signal transduction histidine kinase